MFLPIDLRSQQAVIIFEICCRNIFSLLFKGNNLVGKFWQNETMSKPEHFQQIILMEKNSNIFKGKVTLSLSGKPQQALFPPLSPPIF